MTLRPENKWRFSNVSRWVAVSRTFIGEKRPRFASMAATRFKMHVLPPVIASSVAHEYEENRLPRECDDHASTTTTRLRLLCEHDCCCIASIVADGDEQFVNVSLIKGLAQSGHLDIDIGGARRGSECFDPA